MLLLREFDYNVEYKLKKLYNQTNHLSRLKRELRSIFIDGNLVDESFSIISIHLTYYNHIAKI